MHPASGFFLWARSRTFLGLQKKKGGLKRKGRLEAAPFI
jgi:hypothetical protein